MPLPPHAVFHLFFRTFPGHFFPAALLPAPVFSSKEPLETAPVLAWHRSAALLLSLLFWPKHSAVMLFEWHHLVNTTAVLTAFKNFTRKALHPSLAQQKKSNTHLSKM